ncbi:MAG: TonB-dependent receptor [Vicinamibacterales bacterium]
MIACRVWLLPVTVICLASAGAASAQVGPRGTDPVARVAAATAGTIYGVVLDERGEPIDGVVISALGGATAFAVTDRAGQYQLTQLPPGPYVVRAHRDGFALVRSTLVNVRPAVRAPSSFTLRRTGDAPRVLAAGVGAADAGGDAAPRDETEVAWRLRRLKRSVLKDETGRAVDGEAPGPGFDADDDWFLEESLEFIGRAFESSARLATALFADSPLYGQFNLLTATAYDDAGDFVTFGHPSGVAFFAVGAPVGPHGDWTARVAMNSGDVTSWTMAGDYTTRAPARNRTAVGVSYSLQRYAGGNFAALQAVPDGLRKVAAISASHDVDLTRQWTVGVATRYEKYDYLDGYGLVSPTVRAAFAPVPELRFHARASRQQIAPGAEEFVPPADAQWVPPQRTFAPIGDGRFSTESVQHYEVGATRVYPGLSVGVRAFRQAIDDQLVTVFGAADPARLVAAGGHYSVALAGDAAVQGWGVRVEHAWSPYVRGSVDYTQAVTDWQSPSGRNQRALAAVAPRALRQPRERIHDVTTTIEAEVPQTATRFLALYKLNTGFAGDPRELQSADVRFDMQLRQGLPFMSAVGDWEMLIGVRSLFRAAFDDRSFYDELLVVRPPKRVMGGLQVRF